MVASVVVFVVDALDVAAFEREGNPPIAADGDGSRALPLAGQFVQVQAWQTHVAGRGGNIQAARNQAQPGSVLGLDPGRASFREESFETFVPKGPDRHRVIVTRNRSRYNPHNNTLHPARVYHEHRRVNRRR
jgi:hypothetical protein